MSQASFQKQQREKARRERNAAKEAKRAERGAATEVEAEPLAQPIDQAAVLAELADVHERFEAGHITFDDFEVTKQRLVEQLDIR